MPENIAREYCDNYKCDFILRDSCFCEMYSISVVRMHLTGSTAHFYSISILLIQYDVLVNQAIIDKMF